MVDADDLGRGPARVLRLLCTALDVEFSESMLAWRHPGEGIWAGDWYRGVPASTGFTPPGPFPEVPSSLGDHFEAALPVYQQSYEARLP